MQVRQVKTLQEIPNIGKAMVRDFAVLGIKQPAELIGSDPYQLYQELSRLTGKQQDPCVLDTFISAVRYMEGGPPKKWWEFTAERKLMLEKMAKSRL